MMFMAFVFLSILIGYLLGSIPFGLILTKMAGLGDIRKMGSGNIGATNVLRTGHKGLALLTVILDASKAGIAALLCQYLFGNQLFALIAGTCGVLGHNFPLWLHFKGGKGVASTLGVFLVTAPIVGILTAIVWMGVALFTRYSSLAAIISFMCVPFFALFFASQDAFSFFVFLVLLSFYRHRANIKRLVHKQETKIQLKK